MAFRTAFSTAVQVSEGNQEVFSLRGVAQSPKKQESSRDDQRLPLFFIQDVLAGPGRGLQ